MADPYRTNPHASSSLESEDMSSFFLNFLQGTSASASATGFYNRSAPVPVTESSSSLNFADPSRFYTAEFKEGVENVFASAGLGDCDGMNSANRREFLEDDKVDNFGFSSEVRFFCLICTNTTCKVEFAFFFYLISFTLCIFFVIALCFYCFIYTNRAC